MCSCDVLVAYGSFRSVAIYQYMPTAKHGQAMPAAKQHARRVAAGVCCLGAKQAVGVLSGKHINNLLLRTRRAGRRVVC